MPYASRECLPGYPVDVTFTTREDVDRYLSGNRITCLLCGQDFKMLDPHLKSAHEMTGDEYREKYGLPYCRGLVSSETSKTRSVLAKAMFAQNTERQLAALSKAKAIQAEAGNPQRGKPEFWKKERTQFSIEHYEEFVRRVVGGRTISDVSSDPDVPNSRGVYWFMKRNKEFAEKYKAIIPLVAPAGRNRRSKAQPNGGARNEPKEGRLGGLDVSRDVTSSYHAKP